MWGTVEGLDAVKNVFELTEDRHQLLHSSDGAWLFKWWGARDIQSIILNKFCLDFILIHLWPFKSGLVSSTPSNIDHLKFHPVHLIKTKKLEWLEHYQSFLILPLILQLWLIMQPVLVTLVNVNWRPGILTSRSLGTSKKQISAAHKIIQFLVIIIRTDFINPK